MTTPAQLCEVTRTALMATKWQKYFHNSRQHLFAIVLVSPLLSPATPYPPPSFVSHQNQLCNEFRWRAIALIKHKVCCINLRLSFFPFHDLMKMKIDEVAAGHEKDERNCPKTKLKTTTITPQWQQKVFFFYCAGLLFDNDLWQRWWWNDVVLNKCWCGLAHFLEPKTTVWEFYLKSLNEKWLGKLEYFFQGS